MPNPAQAQQDHHLPRKFQLIITETMQLSLVPLQFLVLWGGTLKDLRRSQNRRIEAHFDDQLLIPQLVMVVAARQINNTMPVFFDPTYYQYD